MRALPRGARLLFGGFRARDLRFGLLDGGLTLAIAAAARASASRRARSAFASVLWPAVLAPAFAGSGGLLERPPCRNAARLRLARGAPGCGFTPSSASKPAGCSACVSRPGDSGGSVASDSASNVRASASAPGFDPAEAARRSASATASAIACRCASLAARTSADRPSSAAICALRSRSPALHQPIVGGARAPVDLVHRPRHQRRLRERADALRIVAAQRFRERVARAGEFVQRLLIEVVDFRVERGRHAEI